MKFLPFNLPIHSNTKIAMPFKAQIKIQHPLRLKPNSIHSAKAISVLPIPRHECRGYAASASDLMDARSSIVGCSNPTSLFPYSKNHPHFSRGNLSLPRVGCEIFRQLDVRWRDVRQGERERGRRETGRRGEKRTTVWHLSI